MHKFLRIAGLALLLVAMTTGLAVAAEGAEGASTGDWLKPFIALSAGVAIAFSSAFGALGQGKAIAAALSGIARNPGAAGKITTPMIIGLAMIESLVIYALVISLILVFKL
jgi:F-type H+-transporting ATPase subunit c